MLWRARGSKERSRERKVSVCKSVAHMSEDDDDEDGSASSWCQIVSSHRLSCICRPCKQLKTLQRPPPQSVVDLNRILDVCVSQGAACLKYLDANESDYMSSFSHREEAEGEWTLRPVCPKPLPMHHDAIAPMLYHTFAAGVMPDRLDVMANSFLYTQPLDRSLLIVWFISNEEMKQYAQHTLPQRRLRHVRLKLFQETEDFVKLQPAPLSSLVTSADRTILSDQLRTILLRVYGGIWLDSDTVLLRDLLPLWPFEFASRWSYTNNYNTAVLRLFPHSEMGNALWERAISLDDRKMHPHAFARLLDGTRYKLLALPSPLVDPVWLTADNIAQEGEKGVFAFRDKSAFFSKSIFTQQNASEKESSRGPCPNGILPFFEGAFAYHWSGGVDNKLDIADSFFVTLKTILADYVAGKIPSQYGEMLAASSM